jgi:hypothetical protein
MTCLDENFLLAFVGGRLSALERRTLVLHLGACAECRRFVVEVLRAWPAASDTASSDGCANGDGKS